MRRILCWFVGHDWYITRMCAAKAIARVHVHTLAGCDADCARCGEEWRDIDEQDAWSRVTPPSVIDPPLHAFKNTPRKGVNP